jgi:cytosine/adenosine deaminase-related metal-dependent hydrolase
VVDMCAAGPDRAHAETRLRAKAQAYRQAGLRAVIAPGERWQNRIVHGAGEEAAFLATLPPPLRARLQQAEAARQRLTPADYLDLLGDLIGENDGHVDFWFGPTGPQWTPDDLLTNIARHAERLDTRVQTHALESHYESIESPRIRDHSVIDHFTRLGLLNDRLSLAHAVWATDADMDQISRAGSQVSHNPGSNLRLRSGVAPAARMRAAGVTTALGMDGTTLAGDEDMFAEMRLALNLNRAPHASGPSLDARDVLEMATIAGAQLLGRAEELGRLHPGFLADAVVLDLSRLLNPWTDLAADPVDLIIGRARAGDVRDVLVGGRPVLRNGAPAGIDADALTTDLHAALDANPPDPDTRALQANLRPWLMDWYARWDNDHADTNPPVQRYGARPLPTGKETS